CFYTTFFVDPKITLGALKSNFVFVFLYGLPAMATRVAINRKHAYTSNGTRMASYTDSKPKLDLGESIDKWAIVVPLVTWYAIFTYLAKYRLFLFEITPMEKRVGIKLAVDYLFRNEGAS
ncbi:UDP-Glycosyltransferase superfamily protein, partial [Striga asiatica]